MWKAISRSLSPPLLAIRSRSDDDIDITSGSKPFGLLAFVVVLFVYTLTVAPTVYTFDSAELTLGVYYQGIVHSSGYPAYLLLGRGFMAVPLHPDYAVRLNLFSVALGAVTASLLFRINARIIGYLPAANMTAVLLFAFSPEIWAHSVVAEVYALHTALIALGLYIYLLYTESSKTSYLYIFAAVFGIAFAHHLASVLVALVLYPFALWRAPNWRLRFRMVVITASITAVLYLYLPLRFASDPQINILVPHFDRNIVRPDHLVWLILGGMFDDRMFSYPLSEYLVELLRFVWQLLRHFHIAVLIGLIGIYDLWSRSRTLGVMLLGVFWGQVLFFASYDVFDKWTMLHTAYLVWAIFVAAGLARLMEFGFNRIAAALLVMLIVLQVSLNWTRAGHFRDTSVGDSVEQTLNNLPEDALLLGPWTTIWPALYYQKLKGTQPNVTLYNYTVLGLGMRDRMPDASDRVWIDAVQAEIDAAIRCHPYDVYIVDPVVVEGRYETSFVSDQLYLVHRGDSDPACATE